jgi:hypothetical protein
MSFELFLQAFSGGAPAGIPAAAIRAAFGAALSEREEDFWQLEFGPGQSSDLFLAPLPGTGSDIHTVSVYRPCNDARLYAGLWALLALPGTCLHFPGGPAPLVRGITAATDLPRQLLEALGPPAVLASPDALAQAIGDVRD